MNFKEFLEQNTVGYHNDTATGAYLSTNQSGSEMPDSLEGRGMSLPGTDLVPTITRSARITYVERNKNPIFVLLADGTRLHFTWDEFNRISGQPEVGRTMTVIFQRFPGDQTENLSQIQSVTVR